MSMIAVAVLTGLFVYLAGTGSPYVLLACAAAVIACLFALAAQDARSQR